MKNGRDYTIRTCDPLLPKQMLYQTELSPEEGNLSFPPAALQSIPVKLSRLSEKAPVRVGTARDRPNPPDPARTA